VQRDRIEFAGGDGRCRRNLHSRVGDGKQQSWEDDRRIGVRVYADSESSSE
jgi:hypothetical protein